jgi:hypothetical protein
MELLLMPAGTTKESPLIPFLKYSSSFNFHLQKAINMPSWPVFILAIILGG